MTHSSTCKMSSFFSHLLSLMWSLWKIPTFVLTLLFLSVALSSSTPCLMLLKSTVSPVA